MPGPADNVVTADFTGVATAGSAGPGSSGFTSLLASFSSAFAATTAEVEVSTGTGTSQTAASESNQSSQSTSIPSSESNTAAGASGTTTSDAPTTFTTSTTASGSTDQALTPTDGRSGTASSGAASTNAAELTREDQCSSISCSSGLQAAVAVPVVIGVLAILALFFFFARRRRRRNAAGMGSLSEKKKPAKKWSRHLRVFSFDAELLMGGRFSSTNSIRSRNTPSLHGSNSVRSTQASIHSIEEVAPPYRDAISHTDRPRGLTSPSHDSFPRPSSTATAPPTYGSIMGSAPTAAAAHDSTPTTPTSARNPFADAESPPVSPIDGSPFNDPPEEYVPRPIASRTGSLYQIDEVSILGGSDAGSVHEAQVGRRLSVRSAGRTTNKVRGSS